MTFRANKDGNWVGGDDQSQGTTVYGKLGSDWLYAKSVWANKNGDWVRAWTDCRKLGAEGGRDWVPTALAPVYSGSCGNRTYQIPTRYSKTGCPSYDVAGATVADPNCSGCYNADTVTQEYFDGSCSTRRLRTKTVTNPIAGSNCPSTTTYGAPYASPDCGSVGTACWTNVTCNYLNSTYFVFNGVSYTGVFDFGGGCYGYNDGPCWDSFYTCGGSQGTISFCF